MAPVASNVQITGDVEVNKDVTATFDYTDAEGDLEGETTYKWYMANDAAGAGEIAITGATAATYRIQEEQDGKFLRVVVTPKAQTGTTTGITATSIYIGEVGEATTVTFMYNAQEVTYGIISRPSGKKWLDRNLGATRTAQSINDYLAYGDMFQWGRAADGHQRVARTGVNDADVTGLTGITSTIEPYETSLDNTPETDKFIIVGIAPRDWRNPQENNLWQGVDGVNNPCPTGWRIPTKDDWMAEELTSGDDGFSKLKLTLTGRRNANTGNVTLSTNGLYWTSTSQETSSPGLFASNYFVFDATQVFPITSTTTNNRGNGLACRCVK
jgi:uncharacterized protein (TIGR02145 family)